MSGSQHSLYRTANSVAGNTAIMHVFLAGSLAACWSSGARNIYHNSEVLTEKQRSLQNNEYYTGNEHCIEPSVGLMLF